MRNHNPTRPVDRLVAINALGAARTQGLPTPLLLLGGRIDEARVEALLERSAVEVLACVHVGRQEGRNAPLGE